MEEKKNNNPKEQEVSQEDLKKVDGGSDPYDPKCRCSMPLANPNLVHAQ